MCARKAKRVLIVDDDRKMTDVLCNMIDIFDVEYKTADDGEEAMKILEKENYHLIITDSQLNSVSGFTLLKYVKENHPNTKVAITSTRNSEMTQTLAIKDKADFYLPRPFKTTDVEDILKKVF